MEARLLARCREAPGAVLACYSPQNVDRLVSVYRAAIRSGRDLVLDLYGASIGAATGRETIPQADWERVRIFVPRSQAIAVKHSEQFWRVNEISSSRIYPEELAEDPAKWVISFRTSMARELADGGALTQAQAVWSMWAGYLQGESGERTRKEFQRLGIGLEVIHASGHANLDDLQRLARAISAVQGSCQSTPTRRSASTRSSIELRPTLMASGGGSDEKPDSKHRAGQDL